MNMRRLEGDTERTITPDELCNRIVPLQRAHRLADTDEWPAFERPAEPDRTAEMTGWVLYLVSCAVCLGAGIVIGRLTR